MKKPLFSVIVILVCYCFSCKVKNNDFKTEVGYIIDSSFELSDSSNEIICIKYNSRDSITNPSINFKYFIKTNEKWVLKSEFDSLECWNGEITTDHFDFNNDGINDFVFKAQQAIRGANFWNHIILYKPKEKKFEYLKGSKLISSPWYNKEKMKIMGVFLYGSKALISEYKIEKDTIINISEELWENDSIIKKTNIQIPIIDSHMKK